MSSRKRGQGEGNIYRRKDGRWAGRISDGYRNGKRARQWFYGETRADVATKVREALQAQEKGVLVAPARTTVEQFMTSWLKDCAKDRLRPRTHVSYSQVVNTHISPVIGRIPLQKLTPQHVQKWLNGLRKAGLSPRTCQYARAILRSALSQALRWGVVARNVATMVDAPRAVRQEIRPLNPEQARVLLEFSRSHRLGALFTVALALGLRQGEALG
jgi:integrase